MKVPISLNSNDEIIIYQSDGLHPIEVRVTNDTVWLTQSQIAAMFGVQKAAISKHLKTSSLREN